MPPVFATFMLQIYLFYCNNRCFCRAFHVVRGKSVQQLDVFAQEFLYLAGCDAATACVVAELLVAYFSNSKVSLGDAIVKLGIKER